MSTDSILLLTVRDDVSSKFSLIILQFNYFAFSVRVIIVLI